MSQKRIQFIIDNTGNWNIKTLEGFTGESCVEQTRDIEIAIGGVLTSEGKTSAYYEDDGNNDPIYIKQ